MYFDNYLGLTFLTRSWHKILLDRPFPPCGGRTGRGETLYNLAATLNRLPSSNRKAVNRFPQAHPVSIA